MSKIKESLQENMEFIRSQLPKELKESAESCLDNCEVELDDADLSKQQILHSLPDEIKEGIDGESVLPVSEPAPSIEQQKAMVKQALPKEFHADFEKNVANELLGE